jgi:thiol-disulfide isomerase/thioredoxin
MRLCIFLLFVATGGLFAQIPPKVTLSGLNARVESHPDTLFVLNYWATWCKPCVLEMPYFEQVAKENANRPMKVIFVSLDLASEYENRLAQFLKRKQLQCEVLFLDEPKIQTKIDEIDPSWTGALPATTFVRKSTQTRIFHEGDYTLESLQSEISKLNP